MQHRIFFVNGCFQPDGANSQYNTLYDALAAKGFVGDRRAFNVRNDLLVRCYFIFFLFCSFFFSCSLHKVWDGNYIGTNS